MKVKQLAKITAINLLLIGAGVLLFEAGLQIVAFLRPSYSVLFLKPDPDLGWKMVPNYKWKWAGNHWYANAFSLDVQSNSLGFRGAEIKEEKSPGTVRVAMIGDSFIEAIQVPLEQTATKVTEKILNSLGYDNKWEFLNFGISNYGIGQYLLVWNKYVSKYSPGYVVFIISDLQMKRTISSHEAGAFANTKKDLLSIRPVFTLSETGDLNFEPATDYRQFAELQKGLINTYFDGHRSKRKQHGLLLPKYLEAIIFRLNYKLTGVKGAPNSASSELDYVHKVNYLLIQELAKQVSSSGSKLIMLDASKHLGDPSSTSDFLEKTSLDLGIHYIPIYKNLLKSDRSGQPTTFHTDGHYNILGNSIVAEILATKIKELADQN